MTPDDFMHRILYQDASIIVFDKPSGLAVHGGPATPVHLEGMLAILFADRQRPPRPAHRLDRDTSGCLVLARHDKALSRLGRLFADGKVSKTYWAVVEGRPSGREGTINLALAKVNDRKKGWRMVPDSAGQRAMTRWRLLGEGNGLSWLELCPGTGRTHQIRVHCAHGLGCPVLGDPVYGHAGPPLHLMSRRISIPYRAGIPPVMAVAPVPDHMRGALSACGWTGEEAGTPLPGNGDGD